jgi:hypothetical protein
LVPWSGPALALGWDWVLDVWTELGVGGTDGCGVGLRVGFLVGANVGEGLG